MPARRRRSNKRSNEMTGFTNHDRGYIPHIEVNKLQFVTIRLYDSLPQEVLTYCKQMSEWLSSHKQQDSETQQKKMSMMRIIDKYEDAGYGQCFLRNPAVACMVQDAMKYLDGKQFNLFEWCIMPNHIHMLILLAEDTSLSTAMYTLKSYTAKQANKMLHRQGPFWGREYFDRYIRDNSHYKRVVNYIANNPVKANLVDSIEQWEWRGTQGRLIV
jgi:REP element-mobilizing transposase RayT